MVQTPIASIDRDRSLPQGTLSQNDPRVFREGGRIDFNRLNQMADAVKRGVVSGGENFAYEPVQSVGERDKEEKAEKAFLREEILSSLIEQAETTRETLAAANAPLTRTVSQVDLGGGWGYTDVTLRNQNGDYAGGMCMAPGATVPKAASFAKESDNFANKTAENPDNIFVATGKKIGTVYDDVTGWGKKALGGVTDSLSSLFSDNNKNNQISVAAPKPAPTKLGLGYDEPQGPTLGYGA